MGSEMNYDTSDIQNCEYIRELAKVYFEPPKQTEDLCSGYKNQYTKDASKVCAKCAWFDRGGVINE